MKTTVLICIALLFGLTLSAQNLGTQPPYASNEYQQMILDNNDPHPWSVAPMKNDVDWNDPVPYIIVVTKNAPLDANMTNGGPAKKTYGIVINNNDLPNFKHKYNIADRRPNCMCY